MVDRASRRSWLRLRATCASRCRRPRSQLRLTTVDFNPDYNAAIARFVDLAAIQGLRIQVPDRRHVWCRTGCDRGNIHQARIPFVEIRNKLNPAFTGINPEPILPHIKAAQVAVIAEKCDAGLITDGDAAGIGAVDEHGNVVDAHKILAILAKWLLERKRWPGVLLGRSIRRRCWQGIAAKYGRRLMSMGSGSSMLST